MEVQRTSVDNTPLLVNFLRLIRDARSPNYKDHEKGPVTFHFGGLSMRDTGNYAGAEELWWAASRGVTTGRLHGGPAITAAAISTPFRGPLYLVSYLNEAAVEVWTLQDYRDPATDHSVPSDFEQLEALNTLVRVLFAHLRSQDIYGVVLQSCVTTADDVVLEALDGADRQFGSRPVSPLFRGGDGTSHTLHAPHPVTNRVSLRLFDTAEACPLIPAAAQQHHLWSSADFVRIDVVVNKAWRYQTTPPLPTFANAVAVNPVQEKSSPIRTSSAGQKSAQAEGTGTASHTTSPEITGSLGKASLPTPHLAPAATSPASLQRLHAISPITCFSPPLGPAGRSPMLPMTALALPPAEGMESGDARSAWRHNSAPLARHRSAKAKATTPSITTAQQMGAAGADRLDDAVALSQAPHVRLMGTLVTSGKDSGSSSVSSLAAGRRRSSAGHFGRDRSGIGSPSQRKIYSLAANASVGALSGLELDREWAGSDMDLQGFYDEEGESSALHSPSSAATEQLLSLLGICASAKLRHVAPAPFGDLVIALNLEDSAA